MSPVYFSDDILIDVVFRVLRLQTSTRIVLNLTFLIAFQFYLSALQRDFKISGCCFEIIPNFKRVLPHSVDLFMFSVYSIYQNNQTCPICRASALESPKIE